MKYLEYLLIFLAVYVGGWFGLSYIPWINHIDWKIFYGVFFFANIADYHSTKLYIRRKYEEEKEVNPFAVDFFFKHKKLWFFIKLIAVPLLFWWLFDSVSKTIPAVIALIFVVVATNNYIRYFRRRKVEIK